MTASRNWEVAVHYANAMPLRKLLIPNGAKGCTSYCEGSRLVFPAMKIATWNVNGIRARASQLHEWVERERPDVVCLQELKAEPSQVPDVVQRQEYHGF
jgi:hypothetical protein